MNRNGKAQPLAVALRYDGKSAPRVTAKGKGEVAARILELARKNQVVLQTDPELTELLSRIRLGDEIPRELFVAVAQVIAFAYGLKGKRL